MFWSQLLSFLLMFGGFNQVSNAVDGIPETNDFDIAILNGRVIDPETNLDATRNAGFLSCAPRRIKPV